MNFNPLVSDLLTRLTIHINIFLQDKSSFIKTESLYQDNYSFAAVGRFRKAQQHIGTP